MQTSELRDLAVTLGLEAGSLAARMRYEGVEVADLKSTPTDVVTKADRAVETFVRDELARRRPGDGFFGEESDATSSNSGLTWVVDPIDGTVNYLYDIPQWAVSIAVVEGDDPATWTTLAGAVVNPRLSEVYAADRGRGATLNERELRLAEKTELATSLCATGFAYSAERRIKQARVLPQMIDKIRDIRRMGAASLDLCGVATGRLDAYWEFGLKPWDHAAGALVAREAGAIVSGMESDREGEEFTLAANPGIHSELREVLRPLV